SRVPRGAAARTPTEQGRARGARRPRVAASGDYLVAVGREVHVVLRAGPAAAPAPADRAERGDHGRRDHALAQARAVEVRAAAALARPAAAGVRVLDRVQVDRLAVRVHRPVAGARAAGAGRGDGVAAVEGGRLVAAVVYGL